MRTSLLLTLSVIIGASLQVQAQQTITGNGGSGFGGTIGNGSITLNSDGTNLSGTLTRGGDFNDILVIYLDTRAGGVTSTAGLTDNADGGRAATSGLTVAPGSDRSVVTFPAGFTADYALTIGNGFSVLFDLSTPGSFGATGGTFVSTGANTNTFSVPLANLVEQNAPVTLVGTYLAQSAFRSNETLGTAASSNAPAGAANIGNSNNQQNNGGNLTFNSAIPLAFPLPISLAAFDARASRDVVDVAWTTASERDNAGFAVERSRDGQVWTELTWVTGAGDSQAALEYTYTDRSPAAGTNYYRLRQRDYDGQESLSYVVSVENNHGGAVAVHNFDLEGEHPVRSSAQVRNTSAAAIDVTVLSATGQQMGRFRVEAGDVYRLDVSDYGSGVYLLNDGQGVRQMVVR